MKKRILILIIVIIAVLLTVTIIYSNSLKEQTTPIKPKKEDALNRFSSEKELYDKFKSHLEYMYDYGPAIGTWKRTINGPRNNIPLKKYSEIEEYIKEEQFSEIIKIDKENIYLLNNFYEDKKTELIIINKHPTSEILSKTTFENFVSKEMYLHQDKLVLIGDSLASYDYSRYSFYTNEQLFNSEDEIPESTRPERKMKVTNIKIIDISNKKSPKILKEHDFEGELSTSKKTNEYIYFISITNPRFYLFSREYDCEDLAPLSRDVTKNKNTELKPMVACDNIGYIPSTDLSKFSIIVGVSLNSLNFETEVVAGTGRITYFSENNLYLLEHINPRFSVSKVDYENFKQETIISKFNLEKGDIIYQTTEKIEGYVLNNSLIDERNETLRVIVSSFKDFDNLSSVRSPHDPAGEPSMPPNYAEDPSFPSEMLEVKDPTINNKLLVLDKNLKINNSLEEITRERIYSATFTEDKIFLNPLKQENPFYIINLQTLKKEKELKIPSYSFHLFTFKENYLVGVGDNVLEEEGSRLASPYKEGIKISLFNVSDPENPIESFKETIGEKGTFTEAFENPKTILLDKQKNLLIVLVTVAELKENNVEEYVFQGAYVYDISLQEGFSLKERITHVEEGENIGSENSIKRVFYVDDVLYTLSNKYLQLNSLSNFENIQKINLK